MTRKIATQKHLDALMAAIAELKEMDALGDWILDVEEIAHHNRQAGNHEGAVVVQTAALSFAAQKYEGVLQRFESAVLDFLGEGRRPAESLDEFRHRICLMSAEETLAVQRRNGIELRL